MRSLLLFSSCLIAVSTASAAPYIGVYGGWNKDDVIVLPFVVAQDGHVVGGVLGTNVASVPGLRFEADVSFRQNEVEIFGGLINADHDTTALMGNVAYDIAAGLPVTPYVLAGIGWAQTRATFEDVALLRLEASGLAWQVGGGISVEVATGVHAGIGYRYFQGPEINPLAGLGLPELSDGSNQSVVAEMRFAL